jgi:hypothetical protein
MDVFGTSMIAANPSYRSRMLNFGEEKYYPMLREIKNTFLHLHLMDGK